MCAAPRHSLREAFYCVCVSLVSLSIYFGDRRSFRHYPFTRLAITCITYIIIINDDFLSVNVCGMDNFSLRPFGGCSVLYRKTLSLTVSPLSLSSNCLCAIRINIHGGKSYLFLNVYIPYESSLTPLVRFNE